MAPKTKTEPENSLDIGRDSALWIEIQLCDDEQNNTSSLQWPQNTGREYVFAVEPTTSPLTRQFDPANKLSNYGSDKVFQMTEPQLASFQRRVFKFEDENMEKLTQMYGEFPINCQPFPRVSTILASGSPPFGSRAHRMMLNAQYLNMLYIRGNPQACMSSMRPSFLTSEATPENSHNQAPRSTIYDYFPIDTPNPGFDMASEPHHLPQPASSGTQLADYQLQLMLLEQQNKRRLMKARQALPPTVEDDLLTSQAVNLDYQSQLLALERANAKRLEMVHASRAAMAQGPPEPLHQVYLPFRGRNGNESHVCYREEDL